MADWEKVKIVVDGVERDAQAPIIISASRSTDIPAFYSDWLVSRVKEGYVKWTNPFNGVPLYVSFEKARLFVFWTKNPKPMLDKLEFFDKKGLNYYFQFTLNDYDAERLEPGVPSVESRIEAFIALSRRIGKERVIWRFDPLLLTESISVADLLRKAEKVGNALAPYTSRLVFSFGDISAYAKVAKNLASAGVQAREFSVEEMLEFAKGIADLNQHWGLKLGTCAEKVDLSSYGVEHNRCVDDRLIASLFKQDKCLMEFLGVGVEPTQADFFGTQPVKKRKSLKDVGQREACGCIVSKDIGEYNTCPHLCVYCYANTSGSSALVNYKRYLEKSTAEVIRR
jgi:DNA repair photolyase